MIYLNHAGTSWPKPPEVLAATASTFNSSPLQWSELFSSAHREVSDFFHVEPKRLLLTPSCTAALQLAVQDHPWQSGDRVLTSHFEHHAMQRALNKIESMGVTVTTLPYNDEEPILLDALEAELKKGSVRMLALTAACNVTGRLLPIEEAIAIAHRFDAMTLIDGAQIAGWWEIDLQALGADLFTFAGHKGPQAPWGIGGLYVRPDLPMSCLSAVCDISEQRARSAESVMPGYCDAGSVNLASLAGMSAACRWLKSPERQERLNVARRLTASLSEMLREMPEITVHHDCEIESKVPTVAVSLPDRDSTELAKRLRQQGVITSGGFQCAPQAHQALNTGQNGVIRFSFGPSNSINDVHGAAETLRRLLS